MMRWAIWWAAVFVLYEMLSLVTDATEVIAGAIITSLAMILCVAMYRSATRDVRVAARELRRLAAVPPKMIADAVLVLLRIVAALCGRAELSGLFVRQPFDSGGPDSYGQGHDAIGVYAISASPNTLVTRVENGEVTVHKLFA